MRAFDHPSRPSGLRAYAGMLWFGRPGLADPAAMPQLGREISGLRLNAAWLRAYRRCVGLPAAATEALPPLAPQIIAAPLHLALLADRRFPFRALGLVHLGQRAEQLAPIEPGQRLDLRAFTAGARWVRRGMAFELVTEAWCGGQRVWRGETTALAPGPSPLAGQASQGGNGGRGGEAGVASDTLEPDGLAWRQLATIDLGEALGRRYASIAGDLNPIHQHAWLARPFGFERAVVHGTWTLARALAAAAVPVTPAWTLQARFRKPVLLPSTIRVWASEQGAGGSASTGLRVTAAEGERLHLQATLQSGAEAPGA